MEDKKTMTIIAEDGSIDEVEVLLGFRFNDTQKEYIIYTKNEMDENGNVTIYVSSVIKVDGKEKLGSVESDEDWARIKDVLRELSKEED